MRLTDADDVLRTIKNSRKDNPYDGFAKAIWDMAHQSAISCVVEAPTIEAEPVRHGRVVTFADRWHTMHQNCSECGEELGWKEYPNYCPNCGAKMNGGAE